MIDEKKLIEEFTKIPDRDWYTPWIVDVINEQPTVAAVPKEKLDEIVERLEEVKNRLRKNDFLMESDVMLKAIEIVKEVGGMND